jgi:hypothetical protein
VGGEDEGGAGENYSSRRGKKRSPIRRKVMI